MINGCYTTASQAWAILQRHARDEIAPLRLLELCRDSDRVSSLVAVYNHENCKDGENRILLIDLSRQRMTLETLNHLLRLATARGVKKYITKLAWGQNDPTQPILPKSAHQKGNNRSTSASGVSNSFRGSTRFDEKQVQVQERNRNTFNNSNNSPGRRRRTETFDFSGSLPSMHLSLRSPRGHDLQMYTADGSNALTAIHMEWDRIERLSESIRKGHLAGATGAMFRDVVVVGKGVACMALKFVYEALCKDETAIMATRMGFSDNTAKSRIRMGLTQAAVAVGNANMNTAMNSNTNGNSRQQRRIRFLSSIDPIAAASLISELDPSSTLVISIALTGNEETGIATRTLKSWLLHSLAAIRRPDLVLSKHMMLVTGSDRIAKTINKPESVFLLPDHSRCEAFISFSAATLMPLAIVFGWPIVQQFIDGAHDMDSHFVETNPRHNLPILMALTDVWNDAFFASSGRVVTPYSEALKAYPAFVAALEAQACSKPYEAARNVNTGAGNGTRKNPTKSSCSNIVIDGGLSSAYDRAFVQGGSVINSELIMVMNTQLTANTAKQIGTKDKQRIYSVQDALVCSFFAHADEIAFGSENQPQLSRSPSAPGESSSLDITKDVSEGNRPSALLLCGKCDAFACGQLVALSEHRAVVKARIWDIDPFTRKVGSSLKQKRAEKLLTGIQQLVAGGEIENSGKDQETDEESSMNLSTKTILEHYVNLTRNQRI